MRYPIILSSEHATANVPARFRSLFRQDPSVLKSHRGSDLGVRFLEQAFVRQFGKSLHRGTVSRLLVELNRSLHHPRLFSEFSRGLDRWQRQDLLDTYYRPYRTAVEQDVRRILRTRPDCFHFSLHTFTPVWDGKTREADVAFLYDPRSDRERQLVQAVLPVLKTRLNTLRIRRNYPYRGTSDGLTTALRKVHPGYSGIEIELNQKWATQPSTARRICQSLAQVIREILSDGK